MWKKKPVEIFIEGKNNNNPQRQLSYLFELSAGAL